MAQHMPSQAPSQVPSRMTAAIIKVCGMTRAEDVAVAVRHGATAVGFICWPGSPRYVAPDVVAELVRGVPASVLTVGVFVNESVAGIRYLMTRTGLGAVQLHGDEPASYARDLSCRLLRSATVDAASIGEWPVRIPLLLDAADREKRGGTGQLVDWTRAAAVARARPVVLAGGLTPENVEEAIALVRPIGVDVSSGVEDAPGVKNAERMALFLERARHAFARQMQAGEQ